MRGHPQQHEQEGGVVEGGGGEEAGHAARALGEGAEAVGGERVHDAVADHDEAHAPDAQDAGDEGLKL